MLPRWHWKSLIKDPVGYLLAIVLFAGSIYLALYLSRHDINTPIITAGYAEFSNGVPYLKILNSNPNVPAYHAEAICLAKLNGRPWVRAEVSPSVGQHPPWSDTTIDSKARLNYPLNQCAAAVYIPGRRNALLNIPMSEVEEYYLFVHFYDAPKYGKPDYADFVFKRVPDATDNTRWTLTQVSDDTPIHYYRDLEMHIHSKTAPEDE